MGRPDDLWVLDTSIAAAWFFIDEPLRAPALEVQRDLRDRPHAYAIPHLFHSELIHVLARKSGGDEAFVRNGIELVVRLGIRTLSLSHDMLTGAGSWACRGLSGYDATFVALAESIGARWLTADVKATRVVGPKLAQSLESVRGPR